MFSLNRLFFNIGGLLTVYMLYMIYTRPFKEYKQNVYYVMDKCMWTISKIQIYLGKIQQVVAYLLDIKNNDNNKENKSFKEINEIQFFKDNELISDLYVVTINNKINKFHYSDMNGLVMQCYIDDSFNCSLDIENTNKKMKQSIFFHIPKNKNREKDFYIVTKNKVSKVRKVWEGCNIFLNKEYIKPFIPILMEITFTEREKEKEKEKENEKEKESKIKTKTIRFQLQTEEYNFLVYGNRFDKYFFQYFIETYYSDEWVDQEKEEKEEKEETYTYTLLVIDDKVNMHTYTEKDVLYLNETGFAIEREQEEKEKEEEEEESNHNETDYENVFL